MKFVMIREYSWDLSKDKIIIGDTTKVYSDGTKIDSKVSLAYLLSMGDFDENEEYNILYNTDSIQIRPKAIYKNNKGYYKKVNNKRIYFNDNEVKEIEEAINKFSKYLNK